MKRARYGTTQAPVEGFWAFVRPEAPTRLNTPIKASCLYKPKSKGYWNPKKGVRKFQKPERGCVGPHGGDWGPS